MTGFDLLESVWFATKQSWRVLLSYMALIFVSGLTIRLSLLGLNLDQPLDQLPQQLRICVIVFEIAHNAIYSLIIAVCMARVGRAMDRPLWKCQNDTEAIRRYFEPWFILNLILLVTLNACNWASTDKTATAFTMLISLFAAESMFVFPLGTCVMFAYGLRWRELGEILSPIIRQFGLVLLPCCLGLFSFFLGILSYAYIPRMSESTWVSPAVSAALAPLDFFAFAAMWRICMLCRDMPQDNDLDDF